MKTKLLALFGSILFIGSLASCTSYHEINAKDIRIKPEQITEIAEAVKSTKETSATINASKCKVTFYSLGDYEIILGNDVFKKATYDNVDKIIQFDNYFAIYFNSTKVIYCSNNTVGYIVE